MSLALLFRPRVVDGEEPEPEPEPPTVIPRMAPPDSTPRWFNVAPASRARRAGRPIRRRYG